MSAKIFLLVDDDAEDTELFCEALGEIDTSIHCYFASYGKEAFQKLDDKEIPLPDIIFLDINMPQMNGWRCLTKLKESETYKGIPVIMYSTSSNKKDIEIAFDLGALFFFTKPNDYKQLKEFLRIVVLHLEEGSLDSMVML
jgi:CheY-like chemotaxis protein